MRQRWKPEGARQQGWLDAQHNVGVRLENGNFPTLSVLSLTSDFVPLSANP
nr:hypothetical protein pKpnC22_008 [Klebsiella pneumoniae]UHP20694.1 hypothetical protein pEclC18_009 [Enterobacter cloacae]